MKLIAIAASLFITQSALCQGLFEEKFDDCSGSLSCLYCGDTPAHYSKDLTEYLVYEVNHSVVNSTYEQKIFEVYYEVHVDTEGNACVLSDTCIGYGWSWRMKDDVRKWLNTAPDWEPAHKKGLKINSTVIVKCQFHNNWVSASYTASPKKKDE